MPTLFEHNTERPLADKLRPQHIEDVVGQDSVLAANAPLGRMLSSGKLTSFILWGPPGCGKTTIARLLAENTDMAFVPLSAVFSGVADLRKVFAEAEQRRKMGKGTLLFVDEIHRFNRSQQDGFLPYVEDGTVVLVGATTENPSFELNAALLSRCKVFVLNRLDNDALEQIIKRAEAALGKALPVDEEARNAIKAMADGDGRYLINMLEALFAADIQKPLTVAELTEVISRRPANYDKDKEGHYNLISALHKSLRGSDPDAALYWCERMLEGGEDPGYILRRLTRFAVEDVGLADPNALTQAIAAWEAYDRLGSPEGDLAIAQLVVFLATAPKSVGVYKAHKLARKTAKETGSLVPPMHILNAPTKMMKDIGYSDGYIYDPDTEDGFSGQNYFPEEMPRTIFYRPFERGFEREIKKRLDYWNKLRAEKQGK
ncbi:MAG: replication-associated recombination protein A [Alphaproteobacteria bacterium]|nr:replication-associated recombination protein A [Alphaproteobacteria bacterium]